VAIVGKASFLIPELTLAPRQTRERRRVRLPCSAAGRPLPFDIRLPMGALPGSDDCPCTRKDRAIALFQRDAQPRPSSRPFRPHRFIAHASVPQNFGRLIRPTDKSWAPCPVNRCRTPQRRRISSRSTELVTPGSPRSGLGAMGRSCTLRLTSPPCYDVGRLALLA